MSHDAYARALRELYVRAARGVVPGLARTEQAIAALVTPSFEVVHVAGTNGKGSVSREIAEGLDVPTGLFTSPHLHRFLERFAVFGATPVDEAEVGAEWDVMREYLASPGAPGLTFFEAATVLALRLFERRKLEVVVLETGLGGRLDSTNVFARPLVTVITRVDLDHTSVLGEDLASIASEKAGILKPGVPLVLGAQHPEADDVIRARAEALGVPVIGPAPVDDYRLALAGAHQVENAGLAAAALGVLRERGYPVDVRRALEDVRWPGRLERVDGTPPVLFDVAHNPSGVRSLAAYLAETAWPGPRHLLFGAMRDKAWPEMLAILGPFFERVFCTRTGLERSEDPARLAAALPHAEVGDLEAALDGAGSLVVAGSLFVVAEARARYLGLPADPLIAM